MLASVVCCYLVSGFLGLRRRPQDSSLHWSHTDPGLGHLGRTAGEVKVGLGGRSKATEV